MNTLVKLIRADKFRMDLLNIVSTLHLPDCYIAAGFIRNLVWDHLHYFPSTPLNDVDVIYFSSVNINEAEMLKRLNITYPHVKWQLKNQALMHGKNGSLPYKNSIHAMEYWPEIETAIGARVEANGEIIIASPFDVNYVFDGFITHNKNCEKSVFLKRIEEKRWLEFWPKLQIKL